MPSGRPGAGRGWLLVATLAVTETTSYGVLAYAFGVFLVPMHQDLGWSPTALTGAYSLAVIVSGWPPSRSGAGWTATASAAS
jgi:hypothetical protein